MAQKKKNMKFISVKIGEELYELTAQEADRNGKKLIDIVVEALAQHFGRPELGVVPRNVPGRPRNTLAAVG